MCFLGVLSVRPHNIGVAAVAAQYASSFVALRSPVTISSNIARLPHLSPNTAATHSTYSVDSTTGSSATASASGSSLTPMLEKLPLAVVEQQYDGAAGLAQLDALLSKTDRRRSLESDTDGEDEHDASGRLVNKRRPKHRARFRPSALPAASVLSCHDYSKK